MSEAPCQKLCKTHEPEPQDGKGCKHTNIQPFKSQGFFPPQSLGQTSRKVAILCCYYSIVFRVQRMSETNKTTSAIRKVLVKKS